jgi:N-acyl-D-amino-acid deacylase
VDLLLSNGTIVDGTGVPSWQGDVLIEGNRIRGMERKIDRPDVPQIDVSGCVVAPGFIDAHSHSDLQVLENRTEKRMQGVTAEVVGNCGFSAFPSGANGEAVREYANSILHGGTSWEWSSARTYLEDVERISRSGVLALTGHGTLRTAFAGARQGALEPAVLDRMAGALDECLAGGSAGFSTGLMYAPGSSAPREELHRLCSVTARRGAIYCTHMRSYSWDLLDSVKEQLELARTSGCRLQISHFQAVGRANWNKQAEALGWIERAARDGVDVEFDSYPYLAGSTVLSQLLPQSALDGGTTALVARLLDPLQRAEIARATQDGMAQGWSDILISGVKSAANARLIGRTVAEIAVERDSEPVETALDLLVEEAADVKMISFNQSEDNLRALLTHPRCTVISDGFYVNGRPHPRLFGTFPELLGKYCREKKWLTLEQAVHKITTKPAARFGLKDAGILRPGASADIVVFDPLRVGSPATYSDPEQPPTGIERVYRKGRQLWPPLS